MTKYHTMENIIVISYNICMLLYVLYLLYIKLKWMFSLLKNSSSENLMNQLIN